VTECARYCTNFYIIYRILYNDTLIALVAKSLSRRSGRSALSHTYSVQQNNSCNVRLLYLLRLCCFCHNV